MPGNDSRWDASQIQVASHESEALDMTFAIGDVRVAACGDWLLERIVATGSVVIRQLGGTRAGERKIHRFLSSPYVSVDAILDTLAWRTAAACIGRHVVVVQDTTEINFKGRAGRRRGFGPGGNGRDPGFFTHGLLAVDRTDQAVVGLVGAEIWSRADEKVTDRRARAYADKESARWQRGCVRAQEVLGEAAALTVVGDRESDIYDVFVERPDAVDLVVRAAQDRALHGGGRLFAALDHTPVLARQTVQVPPRPGVSGREAKVEIRAGRVALARPRHRAHEAGLAPQVAIGLVEVREVEPPDPKTALCWRLLTTHPLADAAQAREVVEIYRLRWRIEQLWRTVKGDGLALDDSQLTEAERLFRLTAMVLGGAVRTLQLVDARDGSPRPATDVLDAELLPAVAQVSRSLEGSTPRQKNPHPPASLAFIAWVAARLGGWNCYGRPPGPKTMRVGWNRLAAMLAGYILAQGSPKPEPKPEALSGMP
jgi:Transposase DDE domain